MPEPTMPEPTMPELTMPEIVHRPYVKADEDAVLAHILAIQQGEFAVPVTPEEQPDLRAVAQVYQSGTGGFWVAEREGRIVGTIGLIGFGDRQGALRKMFVAADARGREHGVAARLLAMLVDHARAQGIKAITLGTIERLKAAVRFYEKNGFDPVAPEDLPTGFPRMPVDTHFFMLTLD
jgi:N-acetylglutamate synthase-like GNAT family acetyltransferase